MGRLATAGPGMTDLNALDARLTARREALKRKERAAGFVRDMHRTMTNLGHDVSVRCVGRTITVEVTLEGDPTETGEPS